MLTPRLKPAILWRSELDHNTASAFSGSVLCSDLPSDETARAVVSQNYEVSLNEKCTLDDCQVGLTEVTNHATFKGGFILPDEITSSEIVMSCEKMQNPSIQFRKLSRQINTWQKAELRVALPDILVTLQPWGMDGWRLLKNHGCTVRPIYACLRSGRLRTSSLHLLLLNKIQSTTNTYSTSLPYLIKFVLLWVSYYWIIFSWLWRSGGMASR